VLRLVCCLFAATAANAATPLFQASFDTPNSTWRSGRSTGHFSWVLVPFPAKLAKTLPNSTNNPDAIEAISAILLAVSGIRMENS
jgi:hypothetical protein